MIHLSTVSKGKEFENQVTELYRLMGYEVKQNVGILGHQIDIVLTYTMPGGTKTKTAVECKYVEKGNLRKNDVLKNILALKDLKREYKVQQLIIVTTNGFAKDVWDTAEADDIQLLTFRELQHQKEKESKERRKQLQLNVFYESLWLYISATRNGVINQCGIRDRLVQLLEKNHDLQEYRKHEYDELFKALYPAMNEEELTLFQFIRGITENTLLTYNSKIVELLDEYPQFYSDVPEILMLHDHLRFWLAKYESVFKDRADMCLVYVGVKDKKPFPKEIEKIIKEKIDQLREVDLPRELRFLKDESDYYT